MNDGGAAFPRPVGETDALENDAQIGMSLRDWFAGQALAGLLANAATPFERIEHAASRANAAKNVYMLADAMLAERAKKS